VSTERQKISAFIVTFQEEARIEKCLQSILWCDEIIVVDAFSTDLTRQKALQFPQVKVFERVWEGFSIQKQFALDQTTNEWALQIDADEVVSPELKTEIEEILQGSPSAHGYQLTRINYSLGQWWRKGGWHPETSLRFFKKNEFEFSKVHVHEKLIPRKSHQPRIGSLKKELHHFSFSTLQEFEKKLVRYSELSAEDLFPFWKNQPTLFLVSMFYIKPLARFLGFYVVKMGFREGIAGFIVGRCEARYAAMKYEKVWEKIRARKE
jgi:glycosyltransferase involved in cell wall biosynthesis